MTLEKAIEILKSLTYVKVLENNAHSNEVIHSESACKKDNEDLTAIQTAISALEKQIPKKPKFNNKANVFYCPVCERKARKNYDLNCSGCGQALDWSDEE